MEERERMVAAIERAGKTVWETCWREQWFQNCEEAIHKLCATVNGHLMHDLAVGIDHKNLRCIEYFRKGMSHLW